MVELLTLMYRIEQAGELVGFMWVPAHLGIEGNELADEAAKRALRREVDIKVRLGSTECRSIIKRTSWLCGRRSRIGKRRHYYSLQNRGTKSQCFLGKERRHSHDHQNEAGALWHGTCKNWENMKMDYVEYVQNSKQSNTS